MAAILVKARSLRPGAAEVTLVDGKSIQAYRLAPPGPDWGNAVWEPFFSGPRGTQGSRAAGGIPQNRPIGIPLQLRGTSQDHLQQLYSSLASLTDDMRRFGGEFAWRPEGGSFIQYFDVFDAGVRPRAFDELFHKHNILTVDLGAICAPYLRGAPYDISDGFDTDTSADYTKDAGATLFQIKGGQLVPTKTGETGRWRHTGRGYSYGDQEATLKITTGSTVTNLQVDLFICADTSGAETFFSAQLGGTNLDIAKWTAGVESWPASTAFTPVANTTYWLRIRREGRRLTASVYSSEPTPLATPTATVSYTMTVVENWAYALGHSGFRVAVVSTGERYDDFRVEPFTYTDSLLAPDERSIRPQTIGDAPALADLTVIQSGGSLAPVWAMLGWWNRPSVWNYIWNGDFEDDVDGWSVAAVTGVTGAATSITRSTTAARNKYGGANGQVVCPATANTGTTFKINRRFYQGRDYHLLLWVSSAAGTTSSRARLGVNGDIASSTALVLSTTPSLRTVRWSPTADRDGAYACFEITAATGTTFNIDGVVVVESRAATLDATVTSGATSCTVTRVPDDWPPAPFLALLTDGSSNLELVVVESVAAATRTLTITRAAEGTSAVGFSATDQVVPLPSRAQYEGKGAQPPVGVLEAESADTGNLFTTGGTWTVTADAAQRLDNYLRATGIGTSGLATADILVDPHLLVPDDYTQGEIAIECWARLEVHAGLTSPRVALLAAPESATVTSGQFTSSYGAVRAAEEYGRTGKPLVRPSSGAVQRFTCLGTMRFPVDRKNPTRWRLMVRYSWSAASSASVGFDYLVCVPAGQRALSPTGKDDGLGLFALPNFPRFISSTSETMKTVRADLSGLVAKPPFPALPDHGLGGSLVELPPGSVDWLLKLSDLVPDNPTSDTSSEAAERPAGAFHLAVTPRFQLARGS